MVSAGQLAAFAAVLPEFVNRWAGHVPAQMLLLSLVSFLIALAMIGVGLSIAVPRPTTE